jgi:hypothetical protein
MMQSPTPPRLKSLRRRALEKRLTYAKQQADVNRILDAVGREHVPKWVNRGRLREDIADALQGYDLAREFGDDALGKRRHKALSDLRQKATVLREVLHGDARDWFERRFAPRMGGPDADRCNPSSFQALDEGLDRLIALAEHDLSERVPQGRLLELDRSAFVILVGNLSKVFERRFRTVAGYTKDPYSDTDGNAKGLFINFVQSVLVEAKIKTPGGSSYSVNLISSALSQFNHAKSRRKQKT